jgi:hypothetical protein
MLCRSNLPPRIISTSAKLISAPRKKFIATLPKVARVVLMLFFACLLVYTTWITGYHDWPNTFNCPVSCTIGQPKGGEPQRWMFTNMFLIFYAYPKCFFSLWYGGRREWFEKWRSSIVDDRHMGQSE